MTFFRFNDLVRIPLLLLVNVMLLMLNMHENPCAVREINILRSATLSGTVWAGIASLLFVTHISGDTQRNEEESGNCDSQNPVDKSFLASLYLTGWFMIFTGAAYISHTTRKTIDAGLAHTFLELERQVEDARQHAQRTARALSQTALANQTFKI